MVKISISGMMNGLDLGLYGTYRLLIDGIIYVRKDMGPG